MSFGWIGAVVQGAKDFHDDVKTGITTQWSYINNKKDATRAYRRQRALYMLDYNLHTPSNQMKLLKEAKLNPNLVYGEGNAGSVAVHMPSVDRASPMQVNSVDRGGPTPFGAYMDAKLQEQQLLNLEQSNRESQSRELANNARQERIDLETWYLKTYGHLPSASASTRMLAYADRAADAFDKWRRERQEERKWDSVARGMYESERRFIRAHKEASRLPPYSAVDGSLYDYLYDSHPKGLYNLPSGSPRRGENARKYYNLPR